jgi:hypothetical protein
MKEADFETSIKDLDQLKDALTYWGKIIQRMSKIKFIRNSRKLNNDKEFAEQASQEEKHIETEKTKYSGDSSSSQELNSEKLKIA